MLGRLGNVTNLTEGSKVGGAVQAAQADDFAGNVLPIIHEIGLAALRRSGQSPTR